SGWRVKVCFGGKESQVSMQWRTFDDQLFVYCPTQEIRVDYADLRKCPEHILEFGLDQRLMVNDKVIPKAEYHEMVGSLDVVDTRVLQHKMIRYVTRDRG